MAAEVIGRAVWAARGLTSPAIPAAAPTGPSATGSHIILFPKLALSCSKKISAAVMTAPAPVRTDSVRPNSPCRTSWIASPRRSPSLANHRMNPSCCNLCVTASVADSAPVRDRLPVMTPKQATAEDSGAAAAHAMLATSKVISAAIAHSLAVADAKVTLPQLRILVMLDDSGPLNMSAVAEGLGVNASNASRSCDRLVRAGLVDRRDDPGGRRNVLLPVPSQGRRRVASMLRQRRAILSRVIDRMWGADQERLVAGLLAF